MGEQLLLVAQCLCLYGVQLLLPISLVFVTVISISISVTCEHFWNCTEKRNARYAAYWKSLDARYLTHSECEVKVLARQASIITAVIANWNIYTQKKYSTATRSQARTHFAHADTTVADLTRTFFKFYIPVIIEMFQYICASFRVGSSLHVHRGDVISFKWKGWLEGSLKRRPIFSYKTLRQSWGSERQVKCWGGKSLNAVLIFFQKFNQLSAVGKARTWHCVFVPYYLSHVLYKLITA